MKIDFNIGAEPIIMQLMQQGIFCLSTGSKTLGELQRAMNAIETLKKNGLLLSNEKLLEERLHNKIIDYVNNFKMNDVQTVENSPETKTFSSGHNFQVCEYCGASQCKEQPQSSLHAYDIVYDCGQSVTFIVGDHSIYIDNKTCEHV